jgi:hypothetical protein
LETVRETRRFTDARQGFALPLARRPVVTVTAITLDGTALVADVDYEVDRDTGLVFRLCADERVPWPAGGKLVAEYSGGYALLADLPYDVERACVVLVTAYAAAAGRDPALRSESVADIGSTTWLDPMNGGGGLPEPVRALLAPYREYPL